MEGYPLTPLAAAIETAMEHYLRLDPEGRELLGQLQGRVIALEFLGLGGRLYFIPTRNSLRVLSQFDGEPDCTLRGAPLSLLRLSLAENKTGLLRGPALELLGDTSLAHDFAKILGEIQFDWEEQLSRLTGDVLAHGLARGVRALGRWGQESLSSLRLDTRDYLQEEAQLLPSASEVEAFNAEVDRLRDDVERLAARIARLQG